MLQTVNRIKALERMSTCGLSKKHTHQYSVPTLLTTCERIEEQGLTGLLSSVLPERIQQELICNEQFAGYYKKLVDCKAAPSISSMTGWSLRDRFGESLMGRYTVEQMDSNVRLRGQRLLLSIRVSEVFRTRLSG